MYVQVGHSISSLKLSCRLSPAHAPITIAIDDDLVALHAIPLGQEIGDPAQAARQVEKSLALLAQKEVVMAAGCVLVVGLDARHVHVANLSLFDHLFQRAVDGCDPDSLNGTARFIADFLSGQRSL